MNIVIKACREHGPWVLMSLVLLLFATKTLFNFPLGLISIIGLWQSLRAPRRVFTDPDVKLLGLLFLCMWIPQITSLPDAVDPGRATSTAATYVHYFFAGVFMLNALRDEVTRRRFETATFLIVTFWCADGVLQFLAGHDLFGYPYKPAELSGMFYPKQCLGHVLAVTIPFYLEYVRRRATGRPWFWFLAGLVYIIVLLSGKRVAWMMAGLSGILYSIYLYLRYRVIRLRALAAPLVLICAAGALLVWHHRPLDKRIDVSMGLFSENWQEINRATANRLPIWRTAIRMFEHNWINGVGPRGFRYVYAKYAAPNDFYLRDGRHGQTHPHQFVLEVGAETGVIGLVGFALFWVVLIRFGRRVMQERPEAVPWLLCVAVAWFPLNAHMALYASYWSSVAWWLLGIAVAVWRPPCAQS